MFETLETKDRRRTLLLGAAVVVLALVAIAEGVYIWQHGHRAPGRFKAVSEWGEWDSVLAFDTATGQLCRTILVGRRPSPAASNAPETHPAQESQPSKSGDPILDAINGRGSHVDTEAAKKAAAEAAREKAEEAEFFRSLPACVDIR